MTAQNALQYDLTVRRDGRLWYVDIPALDAATQARTLTEVNEMTKDYITLSTGTPADRIEVAVTIEFSADVRAHVAAASAVRGEEAHERKRAAEESRAAARAPKSQGLTVGGVGAALGISHQRAQQLVSA